MKKIEDMIVILLLGSFFVIPRALPVPVYVFDLLATPILLYFLFLRGKSFRFEESQILVGGGVLICTLLCVNLEVYNSALVVQGVVVSTLVWVVAQVKWGGYLIKISIWMFLINFFALLIYFDLLGIYPKFENSKGLLSGLFMQENAQMLFLMISFFTTLFLFEKHLNNRLIKNFAICTLMFYISLFYLGSGSRVGLVSLFLGLFVFGALKLSSKKIESFGVASLILMSLIISSVVVVYFATISSSDLSLISRLHMWKAALFFVNENPMGIGLGEFSYHWDSYLKAFNLVNPSGKVVHPESAHNIFISTLAELGWLGFAFITFVVFVPYFRIWHEALKTRSMKSVYWFSLMTVVIVMASLTTVVWTQPGIRFVFWFILGLVWYEWGAAFNFTQPYLRFNKLVTVCMILIGLLSSWYYSRFLYSEKLLFEYNASGGLGVKHTSEVLNIYPLSAPANRLVATMYIDNNMLSEAKERVAFLRGISGGMYTPSELEMRVAEKEGEYALSLKLGLEFLFRFPNEKLGVGERVLRIISERGCKELSVVRNELDYEYLFKSQAVMNVVKGCDSL